MFKLKNVKILQKNLQKLWCQNNKSWIVHVDCCPPPASHNKTLSHLKNNRSMLIKISVLNLLYYWYLVLSGLEIKIYLLKKLFFLHIELPELSNCCNLTDGDYSTNGTRCTLTSGTTKSWWMVDIGGPHRVQSVVITNRNEYGIYM